MAYNKLQKSSLSNSPIQPKSQFAPRPFAVPAADVAPQKDARQQNLQRSTENSDRLERISIHPMESKPRFPQPKLAIGAPGDKYEQEADRVARKVVNQIHSPTFLAPQAQSVQRHVEPRIPIMKKAIAYDKPTEATPDLESSIQRERGSGQPLEVSVRNPMEQAFGADFSGVRIHTDAQSDQLNRSIQAKAFTTGSDIFFRQGEYNPNSWGGQELIAHELTHVVQQTGLVQPAIASEKQSSNESIPDLQRKCAACEAEEKKEEETIQLKAITPSGEKVQRFVDDLFDGVGGFFNDVIGGIFGNSDSPKFPPCEEGNPSRPLLSDWLDNSALEAIRHNKKVLSQSKSPGRESKQATELVKELLLSWGCEFYHKNLLPRFGVNSTFGAETKTAVKQFQTYFSLDDDGAIGQNTLEAMDVYMGVSRPSKPVKPSDVGGDNVQGKSYFSSKRNPIAQIYFPTDSDSLDIQDILVLFSVGNYLDRAESAFLNFYGYADKRETADYNFVLAEQRALSVASQLENILKDRNVNYDSQILSLGEIERPQAGTSSEELKPFRRVDISVETIKFPPPRGKGCWDDCYDFFGKLLPLENLPEDCDRLCTPKKKSKDPLDDKATQWKARILELSSTCGGFIANVCVVNGFIEFQMRELGSKGRKLAMQYTYNGEGISLGPPKLPTFPCGFSFSEASKWVEFDTTKPIKIQDFKGEVYHYGLGAALGKALSRDDFEFLTDENAEADPIRLTWTTTPKDEAGKNLACPNAMQDWGRFKAWTSPKIIAKK